MEDTSVLELILEGKENPTNLSLALLQKITNDFSEERKIGQGGFGEVYKGVLPNGIFVAVKRIVNPIDDQPFLREFNILTKIDHQNVVRFLGFCSNSYQIHKKEAQLEEINLASVKEKLFCFEYISKGSLDQHITDELRGLEWETRYEIIMGICRGLCYLHEEKNVIHMDLKPANILLGDHMVPKLTDFGLSRPNKNSRTMAQPIGTRGYIAPEYEKDGEISFKTDIYSLGAIIFELVTGCKGVPGENNVLRRWRHRWNKPPTLLQYQQVTRCIEIGVHCRQRIPEDRPSIGDIMSFLSKSGSTDGHIVQESTYLDDDMLGIEPLKLKSDEMSWSVKLTNKTKACFAFSIERPSKQYTIQPDKGIVTPGCSECLVQIAVTAPQVTQNFDKLIVRSTKVNEGLRVEDISKDIFYEAADEVDLMVVYEPVEATSPTRKAINSSSYEDGARGQLGRRNFRPPKNFSRSQPTNMTYLLRVSDRAIDVTRGAMGCLLHKLGELLKEFNLETSVKEDVDSLSKELVKMQLVLRKVSQVQQDNLDDLVKRWASNVREMSYDLEDFVDGFLVQSEPESNTSGLRELTHEMCFLLDKGKSHQPIGDLIKHHISKQVQDEAKNCKEYNVDNVVDDAAATVTDTIDPRNLVVFQRPKELVGIEEPRDNLIKRLSQVSEQQLRIFSIYGAGGSGKTTLAKAVYDKLEGQFHPMAFVSVGRNPDKKQVLRDIIDELSNDSNNELSNDFNTATLNEKQLIKELHKLLKNKRYFIVIDDIWDSSTWGIIEYAFPENNCGSRVVTTTRIHSVAVACCNIKYVYEMGTLNNLDSRRLFVSRIFGTEDACPDAPEDILTAILKKCGGLPLAIISIASLLAKKDPRRRSTWDYVSKSLIAMFEGDNPTHTDMEQILDLSYIHLPNHLKTCLLSVGKYQEDHEIQKVELLRQWIAEGFVISTARGLDAEDVAENYFNELISMSMIQPVKIDYISDEVLSCRVHDIMLDLIRSKATAENFYHVTDGSKDETGARGKIRRVSVYYNASIEGFTSQCSHVRSIEGARETGARGKIRRVPVYYNASIEGFASQCSHVRSALLYKVSHVPYLLVFKYIRVLHLVDTGYLPYLKWRFNRQPLLNNLDLTSISRLLLLRYLKIERYHVDLKLPDRIGELQQLETLDIAGARLENFPTDIVSLPWLSHLRYGTHGQTIALPAGVERLKSLRTLEGVHLYKSSVENIKGLGKLTNLRKLHIFLERYNKSEEATTAMHMDALYSSISMLSASLRILTLGEEENMFPRHTILDVPPGWSSRTLFPPGSPILVLDLGYFRFERCPGWINQLYNLYKLSIQVREVADGVSIVAGLPSLAYFQLETFYFVGEEQKEESVVIPDGGAFKALKVLIFRCPRAVLTFEAGAMPKLEKLVMWFRYQLTPQLLLLVGIQHLPAPTLKEIGLCLEEGSMEVKVKGSEDWDDYKWERYRDSDRYTDKQRKHDRKLKAMLQKAFKHHYPGADIYVDFDGHESEYLEEYSDEEYYEADDSKEEDDEEFYFTEEDYESVDDEEHYSTEEDDEGAYQVNVSQTSAQVHADHTRQLVQLIEERHDSGGMNITTDTAPAPLVDTSLHLVVREGWQSGRGEGFSEDDDKREDCCNEEDDEAAHQVNESQTSAQVRADTRQLLQLIEEQKVSGRMCIETDVPLNLMMDTSLHLAVGSEGQQVGHGEGFAVLESLQPSSTSQLALSLPFSLDLTLALAAPLYGSPPSPNFSVGVNNDLLVQQGNMLVRDGDYYCSEQDDEAAFQGNGTQTSAQAQTITSQLAQLIEAQQYYGLMGTDIDVPLVVDTSLHLAVISEGRQTRRGHIS